MLFQNKYVATKIKPKIEFDYAIKSGINGIRTIGLFLSFNIYRQRVFDIKFLNICRLLESFLSSRFRPKKKRILVWQPKSNTFVDL